MKIASKSFAIASWSLLFGGIFHSLSDLLSPNTPEKIKIMAEMKALTSQVLGSEFNMFSFFQGFSLMMGLLIFGYGALNVMFLKHNSQKNLPWNILVLNTIITLVCVIISIQYFFFIPIILTGIPFVGFFISLITNALPDTGPGTANECL